MSLKKPGRLERSVEAAFLKLLAKHLPELKTRKMNGLGNGDWPDRLIIGPWGFILWVELKRPGGAATLKQIENHAMLRGMAFPVAVFDNETDAFNWVDSCFLSHKKALA